MISIQVYFSQLQLVDIPFILAVVWLVLWTYFQLIQVTMNIFTWNTNEVV